ncbi:class I SAM-dependent DNA methyltransferase [Petrocella sp. FN5]|uniref:class I SAM-dependent DNA methyltransferase n=1 Tax=Petrocella sp. FN5 TaxID=3032002 RepID=UPI0023DAF121|nr:class I SAM-dependent methyltransferase [Petrocella sp. FN5]MDF1618210.1 class I SAM-dependent methyltransferase [Petrocella sp. FN5]
MIWNKLATKYDRLWVQKYSLEPTRRKVMVLIGGFNFQEATVLDLGCGTGQLLDEIGRFYPRYKLYGMDKSEEMLKVAKSKKIKANWIHHNIDSDHILELDGKTFDLIICSHSFPYYKKKEHVLNQVEKYLKEDGIAIFTQASINNHYDNFVMKMIEKTAESAAYLSKAAFKKLVSRHFTITYTFTIHEKWFMPSIFGFVMRKKR